MSGVAASRREMVGSASVRSTACGSGLSCLIRTRAAAGGCSEISRLASPSGITATPRLSASARATMSSAVRSRASQLAAAPKPSSIRSAIGVAPVVVATGGFHNGPAAARMTSVASVSRSSVSHHGVRAGVSSFGLMSNNSRVGGNSTRRGRGGMSRRIHHSTGRLSRPEQHERRGKAERQAHHADLPSAMPCGRRLDMAASLPSPMRACSAISSSLAGRSVRWMVKLQPSLAVSARISSRWRSSRALVVGAPVLGAAGGDFAEALRLGELDAAGIGEGLFRRIDDLDEMALRAVAGKLRQDRADLLDRAPQVGQHHDLRQRGRRKAGRQARALGRIVDDGFRHAVDHGAAAGRAHQAGQADALAGFDQDFGERERDGERAVELAFAREPRRERHRRRAVGPEPDGVRGLPLPLAHIEIVVARGAPPVDAAGFLAGDEAAELPEVLAGAGALSAMQAVDDGGGDLARLQNKPRQRGGERAACAACPPCCL